MRAEVLNNLVRITSRQYPTLSLDNIQTALSYSLGLENWQSLESLTLSISGFPCNFCCPFIFEQSVRKADPLLNVDILRFKEIQDFISSNRALPSIPRENNQSYSLDEIKEKFIKSSKHMQLESERIKQSLLNRGIEIRDRPNVFSDFHEYLDWNFSLYGDLIDLRIFCKNYDYSCKILTRSSQYIWGKPWPEQGVLIDPKKLLAFITENWLVLARQIIPSSVQTYFIPYNLVDFGKEFGFDPFTITCTSQGLTVEYGGVCKPGSESIMVLESIAELADALSVVVGNQSGLAKNWASIRSIPLLAPSQYWNCADINEPNKDTARIQAKFYAGRAGLSLEDYTKASQWQAAVQVLGENVEGLLDKSDGLSAHFTGNIPVDEHLNYLVGLAVEKYTQGMQDYQGEQVSKAELEDSWLTDINLSVRSLIYYSVWPQIWNGSYKDLILWNHMEILGKSFTLPGNKGTLTVQEKIGNSRDGENIFRVEYISSEGEHVTDYWSNSKISLALDIGMFAKH